MTACSQNFFVWYDLNCYVLCLELKNSPVLQTQRHDDTLTIEEDKNEGSLSNSMSDNKGQKKLQKRITPKVIQKKDMAERKTYKHITEKKRI